MKPHELPIKGSYLAGVLCALIIGFSPNGLCCLYGNERPNIVFIVTDDQASWAMGCALQDTGHSNVAAAVTPNMDRLARDGARFTNCFCATPVCSPARAALATGRYASEFGIKDFIPGPDHKLFNPKYQPALDPDKSVTFAEILKANGYYTGLIGKWHVGDWTLPGNERFHPTHHGFDHFMGLPGGGTTPVDPELEKDGVIRKFKGLTTDILTDEALDFLVKAKSRNKPFLLCFHTRAPHAVWLPVAPEDWAPYESLDPAIPAYPDLDVKKVKRMMREYLASTSGVDRNLGRLLKKLDMLGLTDKTIVILTSDHGYNMGHNGVWHKGNGIWATKKHPPGKWHRGTRVISDKYRPNLYDRSLKTPAIVRWPGVVRPGTVIKDTVSHLDLFPTLLTMAKADAPQGTVLRGRDLTPLLKGNTPADWDQDLYAEYSMINYAVATMRCYRTPRYKLIRDFFNPQRDELYDLQSDPAETKNLIRDTDPAIKAVIADLNAKILAKMRANGDPLLGELQKGNAP
ncbi:MAG: sulfatase-like hydrolase/transferase [Pirellulales bacterium]|nr:sulfatase-like hydrolase/transferase [Pirellulales bacterium]